LARPPTSIVSGAPPRHVSPPSAVIVLAAHSFSALLIAVACLGHTPTWGSCRTVGRCLGLSPRKELVVAMQKAIWSTACAQLRTGQAGGPGRRARGRLSCRPTPRRRSRTDRERWWPLPAAPADRGPPVGQAGSRETPLRVRHDPSLAPVDSDHPRSTAHARPSRCHVIASAHAICPS